MFEGAGSKRVWETWAFDAKNQKVESVGPMLSSSSVTRSLEQLGKFDFFNFITSPWSISKNATQRSKSRSCTAQAKPFHSMPMYLPTNVPRKGSPDPCKTESSSSCHKPEHAPPKERIASQPHHEEDQLACRRRVEREETRSLGRSIAQQHPC